MHVKTISAIRELNTSKEILFGNRVGDHSTNWSLIINASWSGLGFDSLRTVYAVHRHKK